MNLRHNRNTAIVLALLALLVLSAFAAEARLRGQVCVSASMVEAGNGTTSTSTTPEACS